MITARQVREQSRMNFLPSHFGGFFLEFEYSVYGLAQRYTEYSGGYWEFYELLEDDQVVGAYMAPSDKDTFLFINPENYAEVHLSNDALGIVACLYAFSHLSFSHEELSEYYQALYEFALSHRECEAIMRAID